MALHWNVIGLFDEILSGLRKARESLSDGEQVASIGIDAWAVDYALLDGDGALLGTPYSYRDDRSAAVVARVQSTISARELYRRNGLQFLSFNTVYQLATEAPERLASAATLLLIPDLFAYWLTGAARAELTNASTTGLLGVTTQRWDEELAVRLGIPTSILPPIVRPGETVGTLLPHVSDATGLPTATPVVAVGSHDTASAVVAVPSEGGTIAYISSGTWALVGVEVSEPVLSEDARLANFTNESGVDGRIRFLRNEMGLWLLNECLRTWQTAGSPSNLADLLAAAESLPEGGPVFDTSDPGFVTPGDMPARIEDALRAAGARTPADRHVLVRSILDSLAAAYASAIDDAARLSGQPIHTVNLIGGGSRNPLLCRLVAQASGRRVVAGPVEATAMGNALVQGRAHGALQGDLTALRATLRAALAGREALTAYQPQPAPADLVDPADLLERT